MLSIKNITIFLIAIAIIILIINKNDISSNIEQYNNNDETPGQCSALCNSGTQTRTVKCTTPITGEIVDDNLCYVINQPTPNTSQICNTEDCGILKYSDWGNCSPICGPGTQTRTIECDGVHCDEPNASLSKSCMTYCGTWNESDWSDCSEDCGGGTRTRTVTCEGEYCDDKLKPDNSETCNEQSCIAVNQLCSGNGWPAAINSYSVNDSLGNIVDFVEDAIGTSISSSSTDPTYSLHSNAWGITSKYYPPNDLTWQTLRDNSLSGMVVSNDQECFTECERFDECKAVQLLDIDNGNKVCWLAESVINPPPVDNSSGFTTYTKETGHCLCKPENGGDNCSLQCEPMVPNSFLILEEYRTTNYSFMQNGSRKSGRFNFNTDPIIRSGFPRAEDFGIYPSSWINKERLWYDSDEKFNPSNIDNNIEYYGKFTPLPPQVQIGFTPLPPQVQIGFRRIYNFDSSTFQMEVVVVYFIYGSQFADIYDDTIIDPRYASTDLDPILVGTFTVDTSNDQPCFQLNKITGDNTPLRFNMHLLNGSGVSWETQFCFDNCFDSVELELTGSTGGVDIGNLFIDPTGFGLLKNNPNASVGITEDVIGSLGELEVGGVSGNDVAEVFIDKVPDEVGCVIS